jgi:hypothetical protein
MLTPALVGALIGALATGLIRVLDNIYERLRRRESTLAAIAAEVGTICDLIRHQRYLEEVSEQARLIRLNKWADTQYVIDIRANYFSVYESLSSELGLLTPNQITKIVAFYAYCRPDIDSSRPDGPLQTGANDDDVKGNIISLEGTLSAVLLLGDEIAKLPKKLLPPALPIE